MIQVGFCQDVVVYYHSLTFFLFCMPIRSVNVFHMSVCVRHGCSLKAVPFVAASEDGMIRTVKIAKPYVSIDPPQDLL